MSHETVIKIIKLNKKYRKETVIHDASFTIKKGGVYAFVGPNGAGKTTILRMIAGLSYPDSGSIELFGHRESNKVNENRANIGFLVETPYLVGEMSAYDNLKLACIQHGRTKIDRIKEVLEIVGLKDVGDKKVKNYSLGMRQRLGIAVALLPKPRVLVLDEPINGLDPVGVVEVRKLIETLSKGSDMTILISSHILDELDKIATDYIVIKEGRIIEEIAKEEMKTKSKGYLEIKVDNLDKALLALKRSFNIDHYEIINRDSLRLYECIQEIASIVICLAAEGIKILAINTKEEGLENYYLKRIAGECNE